MRPRRTASLRANSCCEAATRPTLMRCGTGRSALSDWKSFEEGSAKDVPELTPRTASTKRRAAEAESARLAAASDAVARSRRRVSGEAASKRREASR